MAYHYGSKALPHERMKAAKKHRTHDRGYGQHMQHTSITLQDDSKRVNQAASRLAMSKKKRG